MVVVLGPTLKLQFNSVFNQKQTDKRKHERCFRVNVAHPEHFAFGVAFSRYGFCCA